jgi:hypothetical protein
MSIQMGNDEFILYIRKNPPDCEQTNDWLGKQIWQWIRNADPTAVIVEEDSPCYWDIQGDAIDRLRLPKTAAQFSFRREILPDLYTFLDHLRNN